jgi:hypothetical protein
VRERLGRLEVSVEELRLATSRLLDAAEERLGPLIQLDVDHYWLIEPDDSFDLASDPTVYAGQLTDDLESIRSMLDQPEADVVLFHDLDHLIGVLRRLSAIDRER